MNQLWPEAAIATSDRNRPSVDPVASSRFGVPPNHTFLDLGQVAVQPGAEGGHGAAPCRTGTRRAGRFGRFEKSGALGKDEVTEACDIL